ncbi:hypothetical protein RZS08_11950, partial [Arthrospira platensis SPKY1]|nr:hypothetical protein [Arthrospira platensis SPKY1]
ITYVVVAGNASGCYSVDTVTVSVLDTVLVHIDTAVCDGATVVYNGQTLLPGTVTPFVFEGANGCDSTVIVEVISSGFGSMQTIDTALCAGETLVWNGQSIPAGGSFTFNYTGANGCDSVIVVNVEALPQYDFSDNLSLCEGDSVFIFGEWVQAAGTY